MTKKELLIEIARLRAENKILREDNACLRRMVIELRTLCLEKDQFFKELISDGLRHGSSLAGKHMADLKNIVNGN